MDNKISGVLETYHQMMIDERSKPHVRVDPDGIDRRMRAVGPQTGQLINVLARSLEKPTILEIGTSYGYSGIWLAEAAKASGGRLITMEYYDYKSAFARDMSEKAGLADHVEFLVGDAVELIGKMDRGIDFVLLDLWKDLYVPCLEVFYPKLNPGAIIVADNMIRPGSADIKAYAEAVRAKPGITSVLLPVGTGVEVSRYEL